MLALFFVTTHSRHDAQVKPTLLSAEDLRALLHSVVPLSDEVWSVLEARLAHREYAGGDLLFTPGGMDADIHFLRRGLVRAYVLTEEGRELTHTFAAEGNLVACLSVFLGRGPCEISIEALEPTVTLVIPADLFNESDKHRSYWQHLKQRLVEHVAFRKYQREVDFLRGSAETRYRQFMARHETIAARIPQYHIASYLGITPVSLSRIRKRINKR